MSQLCRYVVLVLLVLDAGFEPESLAADFVSAPLFDSLGFESAAGLPSELAAAPSAAGLSDPPPEAALGA